MSSVQPGPSALKAIFWGGLTAGALDLAYAMIYVGLHGSPATIIPKAIASGLLGPKALQGGTPIIVLGVALQFLITFVATGVYYAASRKMAFLTQRAILWGVLYGAAIYVFMHAVVVPLSAAPHFQNTLLWRTLEFIDHLVFVGPPMALAVRRYGR